MQHWRIWSQNQKIWTIDAMFMQLREVVAYPRDGEDFSSPWKISLPRWQAVMATDKGPLCKALLRDRGHTGTGPVSLIKVSESESISWSECAGRWGGAVGLGMPLECDSLCKDYNLADSMWRILSFGQQMKAGDPGWEWAECGLWTKVRFRTLWHCNNMSVHNSNVYVGFSAPFFPDKMILRPLRPLNHEDRPKYSQRYYPSVCILA